MAKECEKHTPPKAFPFRSSDRMISTAPSTTRDFLQFDVTTPKFRCYLGDCPKCGPEGRLLQHPVNTSENRHTGSGGRNTIIHDFEDPTSPSPDAREARLSCSRCPYVQRRGPSDFTLVTMEDLDDPRSYGAPPSVEEIVPAPRACPSCGERVPRILKRLTVKVAPPPVAAVVGRAQPAAIPATHIHPAAAGAPGRLGAGGAAEARPPPSHPLGTAHPGVVGPLLPPFMRAFTVGGMERLFYDGLGGETCRRCGGDVDPTSRLVQSVATAARHQELSSDIDRHLDRLLDGCKDQRGVATAVGGDLAKVASLLIGILSLPQSLAAEWFITTRYVRDMGTTDGGRDMIKLLFPAFGLEGIEFYGCGATADVRKRGGVGPAGRPLTDGRRAAAMDAAVVSEQRHRWSHFIKRIVGKGLITEKGDCEAIAKEVFASWNDAVARRLQTIGSETGDQRMEDPAAGRRRPLTVCLGVDPEFVQRQRAVEATRRETSHATPAATSQSANPASQVVPDRAGGPANARRSRLLSGS